jgi:hypothetical protein
MQMVVSPNIVPLQLDQELNSKKMMYYFKYDETELTPFSFSGPDMCSCTVNENHKNN